MPMKTTKYCYKQVTKSATSILHDVTNVKNMSFLIEIEQKSKSCI